MRTWFGVVRAFSSDRGDNISLQKSFSLLSCVWQLLEIVGLSIDVVVVISFIHCLSRSNPRPRSSVHKMSSLC